MPLCDDCKGEGFGYPRGRAGKCALCGNEVLDAYYKVCGTCSERTGACEVCGRDIQEINAIWDSRRSAELCRPVTFGNPLEEQAKVEAYLAWERAGRPSLTKAQQDAVFYEALHKCRMEAAIRSLHDSLTQQLLRE